MIILIVQPERRDAADHLRPSSEAWRSGSRPSSQSQHRGQGQGRLRKVNIEMYSNIAGSSKRQKNKTRSFNNLDLVSRSTGALPRRNLSTSMTLLDLREGMFSAQIPLNALSPSADVTVKVIDSSLELYINDDEVFNDAKGQRSNEGHYRGTIDLPNYVDSGQVQFDVVGQTLCVKATMKGCGNPSQLISSPLSVSNVKSSSTLDLSCLQRRSSSSTRRRKSANDVSVTSVRDKITLHTS